MKKTDYEKSLNASLNQFAPDVLDKIKQSNQFFVPEKPQRNLISKYFTRRLRYTFASLVVLFILVFTLITQGGVTPVVASSVTIDINPSILIELDKNDFVINVSSINEDGELLIDHDVKYKGITLEKAVAFILHRAYQLGYIVEDSTDNVVLISVNSKQSQIKTRIEIALEASVRAEIAKYARGVIIEKGNTTNVSGNQLTSLEQKAANFKISVAKLMLINQIIELDSTYQLSDLKDSSIRELYAILNDLRNQNNNNNNNNNNSNIIPNNSSETPPGSGSDTTTGNGNSN